jgi:hypothetical protein
VVEGTPAGERREIEISGSDRKADKDDAYYNLHMYVGP